MHMVGVPKLFILLKSSEVVGGSKFSYKMGCKQ